jgi:hypothetical protein
MVLQTSAYTRDIGNQRNTQGLNHVHRADAASLQYGGTVQRAGA